MNPETIRLLILLFGALGVAALMLWLNAKLNQINKSDSPSDSSQSPRPPTQAEIQEHQAKITALAKQVEKHPMAKLIKDSLGAKSGQGNKDLTEMLALLPKPILNALNLALSSDQFVKLDLETTTSRRTSLGPADDMDMVRVTELEQLGQYPADPVQMLYDDDQFLMALASDELLRFQWMEEVTHLKIAVVLIDKSGSMDESSSGKYPKMVYALAVAIQLLLMAQKNEARYILRMFDGTVHELLMATNAAEARQTLESLLTMEFDGGGTNIRGAIIQAVADTKKSAGADWATKDIVLITDGQSELEVADLKKILGDCKLHSVLISQHSAILKQVSSSYIEV